MNVKQGIVAVQFDFRGSSSTGVILTGAVFQAEGRISLATDSVCWDAPRETLTRLNRHKFPD
jgi:hypothetical protein